MTTAVADRRELTDVLETLEKLPPRIYTTLPSLCDGKQIVEIRRGVKGYYEVTTKLSVAELNSTLPTPPTEAQIQAMVNGSMFGWDTLIADPDFMQTRIDEAKEQQ